MSAAPVTRRRLEELLARLGGLTIGVLGDFTLDGYWYADMEQSQLSRETPLYPRPVVRETYSLGGCANVAWNVAALRPGKTTAFAVLGDDWRGSILRALLAREGIQAGGLLEQADRVTPFYGKVELTAEGRVRQEDARLDFINTRPLAAETEDALIAAVRTALPGLDALIIADYQACGVVTERVAAALLALAGERPGLAVLADSREQAARFGGLILKPNSLEAARLFFPERDPAEVGAEELAQAALAQEARTGRPLFITRGEQGCLAVAGGKCLAVPGVRVPPPLDTVGAGDTFMSALACGLAAGATPLEAACLATLAAAVTVAKIGVTGTASPEEILAQYERWAADEGWAESVPVGRLS